jgi:hypothetical protein
MKYLLVASLFACTVGDPGGSCNTSAVYSDCDAVNARGEGVPGYCTDERLGTCAPVCEEAIDCVNWTYVWLGNGTRQDPTVEICYCLEETNAR